MNRAPFAALKKRAALTLALALLLAGCAPVSKTDAPPASSPTVSATHARTITPTPAPPFPPEYDPLLNRLDEDIAAALAPNDRPRFSARDMFVISAAPGVSLGCRPEAVTAALGEPDEIDERHAVLRYDYTEAYFRFLPDYDGEFYLSEFYVEGERLAAAEGGFYGEAPEAVFGRYAIETMPAEDAIALEEELADTIEKIENGNYSEMFSESLSIGEISLYREVVAEISDGRAVLNDNYEMGGRLVKKYGGDYVLRYYAAVEPAHEGLGGRLPDFLDVGVTWESRDGRICSLSVRAEEINPMREYGRRDEEHAVITPEIRAMPVPNREKRFGRADMVAGKLKFGDTMERVRDLLGKPDRIIAGEDGLRSIDYWQYEYENGDVYTFARSGREENFTLDDVYFASPDTPGPRGLRVGDSFADAMARFRVDPPENKIKEGEAYDANGFTEDVLLYARLYPFSVDADGHIVYADDEGFVDPERVAGTCYYPIAPYGYISPMVVTEESKDRFMLSYSFSLYGDYDKQTIEAWEMHYWTSGILRIFSENGIITGMSWFTYAAE